MERVRQTGREGKVSRHEPHPRDSPLNMNGQNPPADHQRSGAGEVAQWVKNLLFKLEDQGSDPSTYKNAR